MRLGSLWLVAEGRATRLADSRAVDVPDGVAPDTAPDESTKDKLMSPRRRSLDALRMSSGGKALIGIRSGLPCLHAHAHHGASTSPQVGNR